jgi:ElaA protein
MRAELVTPEILREPVRWHERPFAALTGAELYALLQLRQRVFVVEQRCAYLDCDGYDDRATHVWGEVGERGSPSIIAVSRFFACGIKYPDEASFGRVVSAPEARGTGVGRALVAQTLARMEAALGPVPIRISAQQYLERFYAEFGFRTVSEPYLEDEIVHVAMVRPAPPRSSG